MTTTRERGPRAGLGTRVAARGAAAVVAIVAGAASFEHIASVAIGAGERTWVGYSLPFAIDGLIVVGVAALLEDQRQDRHGRLSARLAILVGVTATLAAKRGQRAAELDRPAGGAGRPGVVPTGG